MDHLDRLDNLCAISLCPLGIGVGADNVEFIRYDIPVAHGVIIDVDSHQLRSKVYLAEVLIRNRLIIDVDYIARCSNSGTFSQECLRNLRTFFNLCHFNGTRMDLYFKIINIINHNV